MLVNSSIHELLDAQQSIEAFRKNEPIIYKKVMHMIYLTRQLQFGYQYMGCLLMDENPDKFQPVIQDEYILSVYQQEIEKLKQDKMVHDLKQLLSSYKQISYYVMCQLMLGTNPKLLVGPTVVR